MRKTLSCIAIIALFVLLCQSVLADYDSGLFTGINEIVYDPSSILCPDLIDNYFTIPDDGMPRKNCNFFTQLSDDTFLLGENGNTCYHVNAFGDVLQAVEVIHPDFHSESSVVWIANVVDQNMIVATYSYEHNATALAVIDSAGHVEFSPVIKKVLKKAIPLKDGLLLCGSQDVLDNQTGILEARPWAAKVNQYGICWEYTYDQLLGTGKSELDWFELCSADQDGYLFFRDWVMGTKYQCSIIRLSHDGSFVEEQVLNEDGTFDPGFTPRALSVKDSRIYLLGDLYDTNNNSAYLPTLFSIDQNEGVQHRSYPDAEDIGGLVLTDEGYVFITYRHSKNPGVSLMMTDFNGNPIKTIDFSDFSASQDARTKHSVHEIVSDPSGIWCAGVTSYGSSDELCSSLFLSHLKLLCCLGVSDRLEEQEL